VSVPGAAPEPETPKEAVRLRIAVPNNASNLELCVSVGRSLLREQGPSPRNGTLIPAWCRLPQACRVRRGALGWFSHARWRRLADSDS
jgi:hypothetical protein